MLCFVLKPILTITPELCNLVTMVTGAMQIHRCETIFCYVRLFILYFIGTMTAFNKIFHRTGAATQIMINIIKWFE